MLDLLKIKANEKASIKTKRGRVAIVKSEYRESNNG